MVESGGKITGVTPRPIQPSSLTITDLYSEIVGLRGDVRGAMLRIEVTDVRGVQAVTDLADHENRIRALQAAVPDNLAVRLSGLERWQWKATGVVVVLSVLAGVLAGWLGSALPRLH